jgi:hypothetical protein
MNTCANCHANDKGGVFRLIRPSGSSTVSRRATQQNLAAALTHIDPARPQASPLLLKAVTDHGRAGQAPIKARSPPYRILKEWIELTLATNPFLREQHLASGKSPTREGLGSMPGPSTDGTKASRPPEPTAPVVSQPMPGTAGPAAPATPVDEFDPVIFNQQAHPPQPRP